MVNIGSDLFVGNAVGEIFNVLRLGEPYVRVTFTRYYCPMYDITVLSGKIAATHSAYSNIPASIIHWNGSSWDVLSTFENNNYQECLCVYQYTGILVSGGSNGILFHDGTSQSYAGNNGCEIYPTEIISGANYMVCVSSSGVYVYDEDQDSPSF
jgi:hypothetical protein